MFSLVSFKAQLFICLLLGSFVLLLSEAPAAGSNKLSSSREVLEALGESRGNTLIAFLDSPFDQSDGLRNLQRALSQYALELNGQPVGTTGFNTLLHLTPRIGLNRLVIQDLFDKSSTFEVSFPAMRSAGVPTSIIEVVAFSDSEEIRATPLRSIDVQTIQKALGQSGAGGMDRVFELIRKRGQELVADDPLKKRWSTGIRLTGNGDDREWNSNSEDAAIQMGQTVGDKAALETTSIRSDITDLGQASMDGVGADRSVETDGSDELDSAKESENSANKSSFKVSADRR